MSTTKPIAVGAEADAASARTLPDAFQQTVAERPDAVAIRTLGDAVSITWAEYAERVASIAAGLAALGVKRGDRFACMLVNRPEFHLVDMAAAHLGATCFSVYNTSSPEQIAYLFGDAGNRVVVTEPQFLERIEAAGVQLDHVVLVEGDAADGTITLADVEAAGDDDFDLAAAAAAVDPDDVATLIYTSGTTGPPKGVELTHANVLAMCHALEPIVGEAARGGSCVSFLPAAHIADRGVVHYGSLVYGYRITDCPDPRQLMAHLPDARPEVWGAVPRVFEKMKAALEAGIAAETDAAKRDATVAAIAAGRERVRLEQAGKPVPDELAERCRVADDQVFSKIRALLGLDRVRITLTGAAPTPVEVLEFFAAIGLPICEVWGMSETSAIATINPPGAQRFGTVGPPIPGTEVRLDDDGEVLVRGPIVMRGYRNQPEKTRETFTDDGWLRTGDIGEFDDDGYLKIVDRKKELIINAAGKNMSPANIEATLKSASPLIGQAVCVGDARPYNVALIVLDPDVKAAYEGKNFEALVTEAIGNANAKLSRVEQIKRWTVLPDEWLPGGDELTPTMKLKRKPIAAKYAAEIDALYSS